MIKAGFVALIGQPNAGKSTLMNCLLLEKVSIVSDKPQTTRGRITGIVNAEGAQVILVDAPGTIKSTSGINQYLQDEVNDVIANADVIGAILSADASEEQGRDLIKAARQSGKPWVAIVTKADLLSGTRTPKYFKYLIEEQIPFVAISAKQRPEEARSEFLSRVVPLLPDSPAPLFEEEIYTTQTVREMSAEFIREACFHHLHQEIPYGLAIRVNQFKDEGRLTRIQADIVVDKENHKKMVIGQKGQSLRQIGTEARLAIENIVGTKVFLELHVSVKPNWTQNPRMMKELGYVVSKK